MHKCKYLHQKVVSAESFSPFSWQRLWVETKCLQKECKSESSKFGTSCDIQRTRFVKPCQCNTFCVQIDWPCSHGISIFSKVGWVRETLLLFYSRDLNHASLFWGREKSIRGWDDLEDCLWKVQAAPTTSLPRHNTDLLDAKLLFANTSFPFRIPLSSGCYNEIVFWEKEMVLPLYLLHKKYNTLFAKCMKTHVFHHFSVRNVKAWKLEKHLIKQL